MRTYRRIVQVTSGVTILLGVAILIRTAFEGVGIGFLIGALFVAAGTGRLVMLRRRS